MNKTEYITQDSNQRKYWFDREYASKRFFNTGKLQPCKPRLDYGRIIKALPKDELKLGIELEIEQTKGDIGAETLKEVERLLGTTYTTTDGSLRDNGLELITAPNTFSGYVNNYGNIRKALELLSKKGCTSHNNPRCGLHVHIGYGNALTPGSADALQRFVVKFAKYFKKLSRRETYTYCEFRQSRRDRYSAVNLSNAATCEIRFFRGTLLAPSFFAALECCHALASYISTRTPAENPTWRGFRRYVKESKRYHYLELYIKRQIPPTVRRQLSPEERQARKEYRERNRARRVESIRYEIQSLIERHTRRMQLSCNSDQTIIGLPIHNSNLPVILTGSWRKELREFMEANPVNVSLPLPHNALNWSAGSKPSVRIYRSRGWGRDSQRSYICY